MIARVKFKATFKVGNNPIVLLGGSSQIVRFTNYLLTGMNVDAQLAGANRDEQMSKRWQFSLRNDEQMSNCVGVKHLPDKQNNNKFHAFFLGGHAVQNPGFRCFLFK